MVEIRNLIKSLQGKCTILLSSHILSEISQMCDRVIIIDKGKIIATDKAENLEKQLNNNVINIIVEDPKCNINNIKERINDIKDIKFIKENDNNEKEYEIIVHNNKDIRKELMATMPQYDITIVELRKNRSSLEDVFVNLVQEEGDK